jgi:hypothetical protein
MRYALSEVRKTLIGLAGFVVAVAAAFLAIASDAIPNEWLPWVEVAVTVGTTYGVFKIPNRPGKGRPSRPDVSETNAPGEVVAPAPIESALGNLDEAP